MDQHNSNSCSSKVNYTLRMVMRFCLCQKVLKDRSIPMPSGETLCISWKRFSSEFCYSEAWNSCILQLPAWWKLSWGEPAWWTTVCVITKIWTWLGDWYFQFFIQIKKTQVKNLPELGMKYSSLNNSPVAWDYNVANTWTFCKHRRCLVFVMVSQIIWKMTCPDESCPPNP